MFVSVVAMALKIKDVHEKINQKQQSLESSKEEHLNKIEALKQLREQRQNFAIELNSINVDELKQWMENAKVTQEQKKFELEELCDLKVRTEEAIRELDERNVKSHEILKALQDEVAEITATNSIKEQSFNNEKQIIEQVVQTKLEHHCQRIFNANMDVARELRDVYNESIRMEQVIAEKTREMQENMQKIAELADVKAEKIRVSAQVAEEIEKASTGSRELQLKKEHVMKLIEDLEKEKQEQLKQFEKAKKNYNARLKREQRRQTMVGAIDNNSSVASTNEHKSFVSEMSSSLLGSQVKAEKTEFEISMMDTSEGDTSSSKKRLRQRKKK